MPTQIPILFLSDSIDLQSGLARITRDLATRLHTHMGDKFRVGCLGRGGLGCDYPFPNYVIPHSTMGTKRPDEWGATVLQDVWRKFAGDRKGVVMTIWDAPRVLWLSRPEYMFDCTTKDFLLSPPFQLWSYVPVDGHTPNGTLGAMAKESLRGFSRVLAYTKYGSDVITRVIDAKTPIEHIPHGIDPVWSPRDKGVARKQMGWGDEDFCIGVVATNQQRKNWGLAAEVGALLRNRYGLRFKQWWHVDRDEWYWSIPALIEEFGLGPHTTVSNGQSDEWMALAYSACDATFGIGAGEGFGYPLIESLACGVPVVHCDYAGGREFPGVSPLLWKSYWLEGPTNVQRPILDVEDCWRELTEPKKPAPNYDEYRWPNLWPRWAEWFERGWREMQS